MARENRPTNDMIRFVIAPDGFVVPDLKARLPGRGAWVGARHDAVDRAVKTRAFPHAFKRDVTVCDDLANRVKNLLLDRALAALGMATRAGAVMTGFTKVSNAAILGKLALALSAIDGSNDGKRKIASAITASGASNVLYLNTFTCEQLSLALGRPNVIHASVTNGRVAATVKSAVFRYVTFCDGGDTNSSTA